MNTLVATKPRTVSQGANTSEVLPAPSGWSGVMVMMDRWQGMWGTWRLSAMAKPLEETSTSREPQGYLPTFTSRSLIFTCIGTLRISVLGNMLRLLRLLSWH
jgi:hypothetical protein